MRSRLLPLIVGAVSLAIVGGVGTYFIQQYRDHARREALEAELSGYDSGRTPCRGLAATHQRPADADPSLVADIDDWRARYAERILGGTDAAGRKALLDANAEGVVDEPLCEQILAAHELGEEHPVVTFLRITRAGADPCTEGAHLVDTLAALGDHRPAMLRTLMQQVSRLGCLTPDVASAVAASVLTTAESEPTRFDDLNVADVAKFLSARAPLATVQLACRATLAGQPTQLAQAIGCDAATRDRILPRYELSQATTPGAPAAASHGEVWLLGRDQEICTVAPTGDGTKPLAVGCDRLRLRSDLQIAARIESLAYGLVRADVIAGVARYDGAATGLTSPGGKPAVNPWFAYDADGRLLGRAQPVDLAQMARQLGERLPAGPLRAACKRAGARYCYDVDWAETVQTTGKGAALFLSRPLAVVLPPSAVDTETLASDVESAFGRPLRPDARLQRYAFGSGDLLLIEVQPESLELRWLRQGESAWHAQSLGRTEGGKNPATAEIVAVFDAALDARPALLVTRRSYQAGSRRPELDTLWLLQLDERGRSFAPLTKLVVREY